MVRVIRYPSERPDLPMSRHTPTRRSVLKTVGVATAGLFAFSGAAAADSDGCEKTERHTVRVEVVDSRTGEPVPQYAMSIDGGLFDHEDHYTGSEEEGVLYLHLTDGEYTLRAASYPEFMHGFERVTVDGKDRCVTIELPPGPEYDYDDVEADEEGADADETSTSSL